MSTTTTTTNTIQDPFRASIIDLTNFNKHVETLTSSQRIFIDVLKDWFTNQRNLFVLVSGGPGSGKTHTVVKTLQYIKSRKIFMAPTARLAHKIGGKTIHSTMRLNWSPGSVLKNLEEKLLHVNDVEQCLEESSVLSDEMICTPFRYPSNEFKLITGGGCIVVIDEVGMIPFWLLYRIVEKFFNIETNNIMVVCMGDSCQLKPVMSQYNVFQVRFDSYFETVHIQMQESKRFTPEYKNIIDQLRLLMKNSLDKDDEELEGEEGDNKIFNFISKTFPVVEYLDENLIKKAKRVLAYKNVTVDACNEIYLNEIMKKNQMYKLYQYSSGHLNRNHPLCLRSHCSVIVTENGCSNATNGTCLTFLYYDKEYDAVVCTETEDTRKKIYVYRNPISGKFPLTLGFALTIHKFQGETIDEDNIAFCFDKCKDLHLVYTALSRVRSKSQILAVVL